MFSKTKLAMLLPKLNWLIAFSLILSTFNFSVPTAKAAYVGIGTCHELYDAFTTEGWEDGDYVLTDDLDCTDAGLLAEDAGTTLDGDDFAFGSEADPFTGSFLGAGHNLELSYALSNAEEIDDFGFFRVTSGATISTVVVDINIGIAFNGAESVIDIGGLAGAASDTIFREISGMVAFDLYDAEGYDETDAGVDSLGGVAGSCSGGCLFSGIELSNIFSSDFDVFPDGVNTYIGGLVGAVYDGYQDGEPTIFDVAMQSEIGGFYAYGVGGLVGFATENGTDLLIDRVSVTNMEGYNGDVYGNDSVGGLVGHLGAGASISNSYSRLDVTAFFQAGGGLVGRNEDGNITSSYATGDADGNVAGVDIGGLVGQNNSGRIESSFSAATAVDSTGTHGGFIGWNHDGSEGDVNPPEIVGSAWVTIADTDAIGSDEGEAGAIALLATFDASNFDVADVADLQDDTTHEIYDGDEGIDAWDFEEVWDIDENENDGFPTLRAVSADPIIVLATKAATNLASTTATLNSTIYFGEVTSGAFFWGTESHAEENMQDIIDASEAYFDAANALTDFYPLTYNGTGIDEEDRPYDHSQNITDLTCNTTYYYRALAFLTAPFVVDIGDEVSFTTAACPTVTNRSGGSTVKSVVVEIPGISTFEPFPDSMIYEFVSQSGEDNGIAHVVAAEAGEDVEMSLTVRNRSLNPLGQIWYGVQDLAKENPPHENGHAVGVGTTSPFDKLIDWLTDSSFVSNGNRFAYYSGPAIGYSDEMTINWKVTLSEDLDNGTYRLDAGLVREHDGWGKQWKNGQILDNPDIFWEIVVS